jgi:hypothetical protein
LPLTFPWSSPRLCLTWYALKIAVAVSESPCRVVPSLAWYSLGFMLPVALKLSPFVSLAIFSASDPNAAT